MGVSKLCGIYCIENTANGKVYIGQSIDIQQRWNSHIKELNGNRHHNVFLQNSWNKHGSENFSFWIVTLCDMEDLNELERYYIAIADSCNSMYGYNLDTGGGAGKRMTEEAKENHRKGANPLRGQQSPWYGRKHTEEELQKMSDANKGLNHPFYGKHHTEETKQKIRESCIGIKRSEETKEKIRQSNLGKKMSETARHNMSKNHPDVSGKNNPNYGKHMSDETKEKIRQSMKNRIPTNYKSVYCKELDRIFYGVKEVQEVLGISKSSISLCCSGKAKSAGKHPETGEPLHWCCVNTTQENKEN